MRSQQQFVPSQTKNEIYAAFFQGGRIPLRKDWSNMSALSGWKDGTVCPAPLTEAKVNPPVYC